MKKRNVWLWIVGGFGILVVVLLIAGLGMLGKLPGQGGELYEDPQGRFSMQLGPWQPVKTDGSYAQFKLADPPLSMYLMVLSTTTIEDSFTQALQILGFDPNILNGGNSTGIGDWTAYSQDDSAGLSYGLAGQIVGENAYVAIVKSDQPGVSPENAAALRALASLKIAGKEELVIKNYADLEALVRKQIDSRAGSISVAVTHKGQIVYTYAYGQANPAQRTPADTSTIYTLGSMTKPFTATAVMQLVEQGKVDLDAWPGDYIPEFPKSWNVTVRELLTHSACMPEDNRLSHKLITLPGESFASLKDIFTQYVKDYPDLVCEPGKVSQYANPHFLALARIVEEVSGEPFESYVVKHVLTPLDMQSTGFELTEPNERYAKNQYPTAKVADLISNLNESRGAGQEKIILQRGESYTTMTDYRILAPWGGLRSTPSDITHFLQMYLDGGRYGNNQVLKPETIAEMQRNQPSIDGKPLGFGLSWWLGKDDFGNFYYHNGGGAGLETSMRYYPSLDLGVVVMGNLNGYQPDKIAEGLVSAWKNEN
jgi:CubicO group peptidase (beta-lactamase class C family)